MPQAPTELQDQMEEWFGDATGDAGPIRFLESHGFYLTPGWQWIPPTPSYAITYAEQRCIAFLMYEWDFGGVAAGRYNCVTSVHGEVESHVERCSVG